MRHETVDADPIHFCRQELCFQLCEFGCFACFAFRRPCFGMILFWPETYNSPLRPKVEYLQMGIVPPVQSYIWYYNQTLLALSYSYSLSSLHLCPTSPQQTTPTCSLTQGLCWSFRKQLQPRALQVFLMDYVKLGLMVFLL